MFDLQTVKTIPASEKPFNIIFGLSKCTVAKVFVLLVQKPAGVEANVQDITAHKCCGEGQASLTTPATGTDTTTTFPPSHFPYPAATSPTTLGKI